MEKEKLKEVMAAANREDYQRGTIEPAKSRLENDRLVISRPRVPGKAGYLVNPNAEHFDVWLEHNDKGGKPRVDKIKTEIKGTLTKANELRRPVASLEQVAKYINSHGDLSWKPGDNLDNLGIWDYLLNTDKLLLGNIERKGDTFEVEFKSKLCSSDIKSLAGIGIKIEDGKMYVPAGQLGNFKTILNLKSDARKK